MTNEICCYCEKEIDGEKIPFMPGKVTGAVKIPITKIIQHPKHPEGKEIITGFKWEARGEYPFRYHHPDCSP